MAFCLYSMIHASKTNNWALNRFYFLNFYIKQQHIMENHRK
jgi:hypothetical protein